MYFPRSGADKRRFLEQAADSSRWKLTAIKNGAYQRRNAENTSPLAAMPCPFGQGLRYLVLGLLPETPLDQFHLIFQAQLQLLQPDLFQLFVFGEVAFFGECIEALCVLRVLCCQPTELLVAGQEEFR